MDKFPLHLLLVLLLLILGGCGGGGESGTPPVDQPDRQTPPPSSPKPIGLSYLPDTVLAEAVIQDFEPKQPQPAYDMPPDEYPLIQRDGLYDRIVASLYVMEAVFGTGWADSPAATGSVRQPRKSGSVHVQRCGVPIGLNGRQ